MLGHTAASLGLWSCNGATTKGHDKNNLAIAQYRNLFTPTLFLWHSVIDCGSGHVISVPWQRQSCGEWSSSPPAEVHSPDSCRKTNCWQRNVFSFSYVNTKLIESVSLCLDQTASNRQRLWHSWISSTRTALTNLQHIVGWASNCAEQLFDAEKSIQNFVCRGHVSRQHCVALVPYNQVTRQFG
jgi:hypothetical protein